MAGTRFTSRGLIALLGPGAATCCGLPLLLAAGVAVGAGGLVIGSIVAQHGGLVRDQRQ